MRKLKKEFTILLVIFGLLLISCSDSGDSTGPAGPTLSVGNTSVVEGSSLSFVVFLSQTVTDDVKFSFSTSNGTAMAGSDYTARSGMDSILAGMTSTTIIVSTTDDAFIEETETMTLNISSPMNASISDGIGSGSIIDNDAMASVSFSSSVRPILLNRCATSGCHGTGSSAGGFSMGNVTYSTITSVSGLNGAIVVPGNSASSTLYTKTTSSPPFGGRMPQGQSALSTIDQNLIKDWIDEGADDN